MNAPRGSTSIWERTFSQAATIEEKNFTCCINRKHAYCVCAKHISTQNIKGGVNRL